MAPAEPVDLRKDGYCLVWAPRRCLRFSAPRGGVALAVRAADSMVEQVSVEEEFDRADVTWFRVQVGDGRALYVAAVYLPPLGHEFCCAGCDSPQCTRSHVREALAYLGESAARLATKGDVLLAGDFNARAGTEGARWREVTDELLVPDVCVLANPVDADDVLVPTRQDPVTGSQSVLDLVITGVANTCVTTVSVDAAAGLSDHYALLCVLTQPVLEDGKEGVLSPNYGFTSPVPRHLRAKPSVALSRRAEQLQQYQDTVDARLLQAPALDSVEEEVNQLERILLSSAFSAGLCERRRREHNHAHTFALTQRRLEAARQQLCNARQLAEPTQRQAAMDAARARLDTLEARKREELPARRAVQRVRREMARAEEISRLQQLWVTNENGLLARQMLKDQQGTYSHRGTRPVVPLPVRQRALWRREQFLRKRFGEGVPLGEFEEDVACSQPPTLLEVETAVRQLSGNSAAIGVPLFPLRWASTPALLERLCALMGRIWRTGLVPASFCEVEVVLIPKPGSADYRVIGVGTALSRLFRLLMYNRVLAQVRPLLSPEQFGFLPGRSTQHASFLSSSTTRCAQATGNVVETVFLDIASAYGTTSWGLVLARMAESGVTADIQRLTHNYYRQQRMFTKVGNLVSDWIIVSIGLTEGDPMSPLSFILVIDKSVQRLHSAVLRSGLPAGIPMLGGGQMVSVWYADDGRLFSLCEEGMHTLTAMVSEEFTAMRFKMNVAPNKSAAQRGLPDGKVRRAAARRRLATATPYQLQGNDLPVVDCYKHVGVMTHSAGPQASEAAQTQKLRGVIAGIIRRVTTAPVRHRTLLYASRLYTAHWLPGVMYAVGLYATGPPAVVSNMESIVLRVVMKASNTPLVALRSVMGFPTLATRYDMDRLLTLLRFLSGAARDLVKQQLCVEVALYTRLVAEGTREGLISARKLWWHRTRTLLAWLDVVCDAPFRAVHPDCPASWVTWAETCAGRWCEQLRLGAPMEALVRSALLCVEGRRRQRELQRCEASLAEVQDLLDTPNMAPFVADTRRDLTDVRVQLRGGRRVLFGHSFFHIVRCPWCTEEGQFNVRHLLRDCPNWEQLRVEAWERARRAALAAGVKVAAGDVQQHRDSWYRLMCGASVSHTFVGLHLDEPTHFARGPVPATRHLRLNMKAYHRLLAITGVFLRTVVEQTRALLGEEGRVWDVNPDVNAPRQRISHHAQELDELRRTGRAGGLALDPVAVGAEAEVEEEADDGMNIVAELARAVRDGDLARVQELAAVIGQAWVERNPVAATPVDEAEAELDLDAILADVLERQE